MYKYCVMENTQFGQRIMEEKMSMMSERMNAVNDALGINSAPSAKDILPFTSVKKYAKFLRNTKFHHLWEMHTPEYWNKQMDEIERLAVLKVTEEMQNTSESKNASVEIYNSSGIVLR